MSNWPGGVNATDVFGPHLYTMAWTSTISPTVLNEFRFGRKETGLQRRPGFQEGCCFTREKWDDRTPEAQKLYDLLPKSNGYILFPIESQTTAGPSYSARGTANWMKLDTAFRGNKNPTQQFSDTLSWIKGSHSFKGGFETVKNWSDGWSTNPQQIPTVLFGQGNFPVTGITAARFPGLAANDINAATDILNDLAASIGGLTFGRVVNSPTATSWNDLLNGDYRRWRTLTQRDWDVFFKDTWNITKNLTLNLGVRYDKYGVLYDQNGMIARAKGGEKALYNYATNGTLTQSILVGRNSTSPDEKFYKDDWNNVAPAVGFSYKIPWFARTTVLRGGYGVNYAGTVVILDFENPFGASPGSADIYGETVPYVLPVYTDLSMAVSRGILPLPPRTQPGVTIIPLTDKTQTMNTPTDDRATPYIQSFNLSIQHDLSQGLSVEVSYIGNKGTKLFANRTVNEPEIFDNGMLAAFNATRAGNDAPLFNRILNGLTIPGVGRVDGVTLTGSQAFRRWASTRGFLANGTAPQFANFVSTTSAITGVPGGLLTNGSLLQNFITASPQFANAVLWGTSSNSTYHSLQAQLRKQRGGVTGQFTYTWSKALGDAVAGETGTTTIDPRNRSLNKGRQAFDQTHVFTGHGTWELPFGAGKALLSGVPSWADRIVGGWQLSSIFSWTSGSPLTLTSVATVGTISSRGVPNIVGDFPKTLGEVRVANGYVEYFPGISAVTAPPAGVFGSDADRLASFSTNLNVVDSSGKVLLTNPEPGKVGTLGTGWVEGPASTQIDLSLAKRIQIRESVAFLLRADAINAPNLTNWGDPNVNINSPNFGRITGLASDSTARRFTFTARIEF